MANDLDRKFFHALLNGLTQGFVYNKADMTFAYLQEAIFGASKMQAAEQVALMDELRQLLQRAAGTNMTLDALDAELKQMQLSDEHQTVFALFWKTERPKVHDFLVARSSWEPTLAQMSWRIDVKTAARGASEISQPTAIVEMALAQGGSAGVGGEGAAAASVFQFEVSRQETADVLQTLDAIQAAISAAASAAQPAAATAATGGASA